MSESRQIESQTLFDISFGCAIGRAAAGWSQHDFRQPIVKFDDQSEVQRYSHTFSWREDPQTDNTDPV